MVFLDACETELLRCTVSRFCESFMHNCSAIDEWIWEEKLIYVLLPNSLVKD